MRIVKLLPCKRDKYEDTLERFDAYIITQVHLFRNCSSLATHPAVLDLEIDDLIQRVRIKLWQAQAKTDVSYPYAYIKRIIHSEIVDMARLHKPLLPLPLDEEWNEHEARISLEQPGSDPAEEVEQQLDALAYLNKMIQAILKLPARQKLAMICSLKDRVDDQIQLVNAFKEYHVDIESIRWPSDKEEKQVVQASLAHARKALAKHLETSGSPLQGGISPRTKQNITSIDHIRLFQDPTEANSVEYRERGKSGKELDSQQPASFLSTIEEEPQTMERNDTECNQGTSFISDAKVTAKIEAHIHQLQEPYRTAISLHYLEKRSYPEMVILLNLPIGTIKSHVSRGMRSLDRSIEPKEQEIQSNSDLGGQLEHIVPTQEEIANHLADLQEPYRTAISLHYLEKRSYPEMAILLNLPIGTVKSHVSRGMKLVKDTVLAVLPVSNRVL